MRRASPKISASNNIISPPYPLISIPQLTDKNSPLLLIIINTINLLIIFHIVIPLSPSLSSPPYIHNSFSPEDTNFNNSSNKSHIHRNGSLKVFGYSSYTLS